MARKPLEFVAAARCWISEPVKNLITDLEQCEMQLQTGRGQDKLLVSILHNVGDMQPLQSDH